MNARNANVVVTDAARRFADIVNGILAIREWDDLKTKFLAIRLSDGGYDGSIYDNKRDAVRHQSDEFLCAYFAFRNCMGGISPKDAQIFLDFNRKAYDNGFRLPDPDDQFGGKDLFMTTTGYDQWTGRNGRLQLPTSDEISRTAWRRFN